MIHRQTWKGQKLRDRQIDVKTGKTEEWEWVEVWNYFKSRGKEREKRIRIGHAWVILRR